MNRTQAIGFAIAACALGALGVYSVMREAPSTRPGTAPSASAPSATPTTPLAVTNQTAPPKPVVAPVPEPAPSALPVGTTFDQAMASTDPFVRRAAIDRAVKQGDTSVLGRLQAVDLTVNGYEAAAAIDGVGKLTALLPEAERKGPVATLARWLAQETKRDAPGAMGNAITVIESLGETKSKEAVAPLVQALDSEKLPLNVETTLVQTLTDLDAREASPSVARFEARTSKKTGANDLEIALITEALQAAQAALAKWK